MQCAVQQPQSCGGVPGLGKVPAVRAWLLPTTSRRNSRQASLLMKASQGHAAEAKKPQQAGAGRQLSSWSNGKGLTQALAGMAALLAAFPEASSAVETAPPGFLQMLLDLIEGLGPLGPAAYVALVSVCELIPLFPTQPLSLASGLLFGAQKGAACMCLGTTLAAAIAFTVSRGVGKSLAEKVIEHELSELDHGKTGEKSLVGKFKHVEEAIEHGSFWKQAGAIFLLRLTPVVPFSASNYLLGLTPLPIAPYLTGTVLGMGAWSVVYASLGGASRSLLAKGVSADALLADLLEKATMYTTEVATAGLVLAVAVAGAWGMDTFRKGLASSPQGGPGLAPLMPSPKDRQLVEQMED